MAVRKKDKYGRFRKNQPTNRTKGRNNENDLEHQVLVEYNRIADHGREITIEDVRHMEILKKCLWKVLFVILLLLVSWLLIGCGTKKIIEYVPIEKKVTKTVTLVDTVFQVQLVPFRDSVSVRDTVSHLENEYAWSNAEYSGGRLNHSLGMKPHNPVNVPLKVPHIIIRDSIPYPVSGPTVYVERDFSPIEKGLMGLGGLAACGILVWSVLVLKKVIS